LVWQEHNSGSFSHRTSDSWTCHAADSDSRWRLRYLHSSGTTVSLRLDYCNSLFYGISDSLVRRLQAVRNTAACLVTSTRRRDHISPVLRQLHWLSVHQLI